MPVDLHGRVLRRVQYWTDIQCEYRYYQTRQTITMANRGGLANWNWNEQLGYRHLGSRRGVVCLMNMGVFPYRICRE